MTFPPIYLIEVSCWARSEPEPGSCSFFVADGSHHANPRIQRLGRRTLMIGSLASMSLSSVTLAYSINHSYFPVAGVAIIGTLPLPLLDPNSPTEPS